ncbi:MAG: trypsin-like peptidase domain-containing protein [Deltaproteobacteria bacterium]|nr:trypsin-like peptidase domain-containing protein [Deltaproteobacteria bacterium]
MNTFRRILKPALAAFLTVTLGGCLGLFFGPVPDRDYSNEGVTLMGAANTVSGMKAGDICQMNEAAEPPPAAPIHTDTIRQLAARSKSSVVNIYVKTANPVRAQILIIPVPGLPPVDIPGEALGSGFFCSKSGFLLTNAHVVARADKLSAKTDDGKLHELEIVAVDRKHDLALLRVTPAGSFPAATMAGAARLAEGDWVVAIGNPLGLTHSVSHGIVSQRSRSIAELQRGREDDLQFLQTDTPINPGNSGGPLFDITGQVVGINTAIARHAQGISFTIPTERVRMFLDQVGELSTRRFPPVRR